MGLKQPQIVASLKEAGLTGAAGDAEKMKKADAAGHAEHFMKENRWVPAWLKGPAPVAEAPAEECTTDNATTAHAA
jgi:ParB family chromosome partitioning protein